MPPHSPAARREARWRRAVDDALFNRDHPNARQRSQRRSRREGGEEGQRRAWEEKEEKGGMDKAYAREYLQPDAKRLRRD